jgi:hypothetical protein
MCILNVYKHLYYFTWIGGYFLRTSLEEISVQLCPSNYVLVSINTMEQNLNRKTERMEFGSSQFHLEGYFCFFTF